MTNKIGGESLLARLQELAESTVKSPLAEELEFAGIKAVDLLVSPLYQVSLKAARGDGTATLNRKFATRLVAWLSRSIRLPEVEALLKTARPAESDILFWPRDETHVAVMEPVIRTLQQEGTKCRVLTCQTRVFKRTKASVRDVVYSHGIWRTTLAAARKDGLQRARRLAALRDWQAIRLEYGEGGSVLPVIQSAVERMLPAVSVAVATSSLALRTFKPRLLVVGNDLTLEGRSGCRVAAQRGVPSAVMLHGSIANDALQRKHCADRIVVFGESSRRELLHRGVWDDRIDVCGAPQFDTCPVQTGRVDQALRARLGLRSGKPWILVATSGPGHRISHSHHEAVVANLIWASAAFADIPFVVKLHRKDDPAYYGQAQARRPRRNLYVIPSDARGFPENIFDWLQGCTALLTGASTAATEAMLMGVPVITMDFLDEVQGVDFIDAGATLHVRTQGALEWALNTVLGLNPMPPGHRSRVDAYLRDSFLSLDGKASQRVASALQSAMTPRSVRQESDHCWREPSSDGK